MNIDVSSISLLYVKSEKVQKIINFRTIDMLLFLLICQIKTRFCDEVHINNENVDIEISPRMMLRS